MRIKGFEKLTDLRSFSLVKREGTHTICRFSFRTLSREALPFLSQEGGAVTVQRDDGSTLFYGLLRAVSVEQSHHGAILFVEAVSYSILTDEKLHTRIFQKPMQTLRDILLKLDWSKAKCELNLGDMNSKKPAGLIIADEETNAIIQNDETDFALLHRLTAVEGFGLWIIDTNSGRTELRLAKYLTERQVATKDIIIISRRREHGKTNLFMRVAARAELDTGQKVKIEGIPGNFIVMSKTVQKERETFTFDYELIEENVPQKAIEGSKRARIFAVKIIDNNDPKHLGRVQVKFTDEDAEDMGKPPDVVWLPYRTPYGGKEGKNGIVFLPDKGDTAEALLLERRLWIANSFRKNALLEECSNVNEKYIGNNFQQRIFWREKSLELASFKNRILIDEKKIDLSVGESQTRFFMDKDKIILQIEGSTIELSSKSIKIKTEKDIEAESSANVHVKAEQNLRFEGNKNYSVKTSGTMTFKADGEITIDGSSANIC